MARPVFSIRFDPKRSFFDTATIINRLEEKKRKALEKAGRFIRSDAQRSMRRAGKRARGINDEIFQQQLRNMRLNRSEGFTRSYVSQEIARSQTVASKPPRPPRVHAARGEFKSIRDRILFQYDEVSESVVVGPTLIGNPRRPTIPESLEFGGPRQVSVRVIGTRRRVRFVANYPARPYMAPALEKNRRNEKLLKLFEDIL